MRRFVIPVLLVFVPIFGGWWLWLEVQAVQIPLSLEVQAPRFIQIHAGDLKPENMEVLPRISSRNHDFLIEVLGNVKKEQEVINRILAVLGLVIVALALALLSLLYKTPRDMVDQSGETIIKTSSSLSWRDAGIIAWGLVWRVTAIEVVPSIAIDAVERALNSHESLVLVLFIAARIAIGFLTMTVSVKWLFHSMKVATS